jgi:hypothetical protein
MPGCILRVGGRSFPPDEFLAGSGLRAYDIWHVGDPVKRRRPDPQRVYNNSGFNSHVSEADGMLRQEVEDAEAFLARYREDFLRLAADPHVEFCDLDFGYYCRLGQGNAVHDKSVVCVQGEYLPNSFLRLAGELRVGVALSLYPNSDGGEEL